MRSSRSIAGVILTLMTAGSLAAQNRPSDRRRFIAPNTPVSDDPRRVPVSGAPQGPPGTFVLRGGRLFDGTGAAAREATVVVERNRIKSILAPGASGWPADARVIELGGKTILPGLIDLHTHTTYSFIGTPADLAGDPTDQGLRGAERLRYFVESGVTSIRDVASHDAIFRLKQWVAENRIPGPRVFAAGQLITATGGHGAEGLRPGSTLYGAVREAKGADDWREAVRANFKKGADVIKIASHFGADEVKAAVTEAHLLGIKVTCDCETFYIPMAIEAGVDMIEHPLPRSDEAIRLMKEKGIESDPTMTIVQLFWDWQGGYFGSTSRRFSWSPETGREMARRLRAEGIKLGVGLDLIGDFYRLMPEPYIRELKSFTQIGYTVPEALVAATRTSAELLDVGDKLGTIEPGKLADLIVVDGRPDQNLDDLAKVDLVFRDGWRVVEKGRAVAPPRLPLRWPTPPSQPGQ